MATQITKSVLPKAQAASRQINAVVVSAGLMQKTVKVRIGTQKWDGHIQKKFSRTTHLLVHDPASSLRAGDVISISAGWRVSKTVRHVVDKIIAPFGSDIASRPAVPSAAERIAAREREGELKEARRAERKAAELRHEEERVRAQLEDERTRKRQDAQRKKRKARQARDREQGRDLEAEQDQETVVQNSRQEVLTPEADSASPPAPAPAPAATKEDVPPKKKGWFS